MTPSQFSALAQKRKGKVDFTHQEYFEGSTIVRPYYDWDAKLTEVPCDEELQRLKEQHLAEFQAMVAKLHPGSAVEYAERHGRLRSETDADGDQIVDRYKISYRAYVQGQKIRCDHIPIHVRRVLKLSPKETHPHLDLSVYKTKSQLLGTIHGCKDIDAVKRFLRPLDPTTSLDAFLVQDTAGIDQQISIPEPVRTVKKGRTSGPSSDNDRKDRKAGSSTEQSDGKCGFLAACRAFFGRKYMLQMPFDDVITDAEHQAMVITTKETYCDIKGGKHTSNHPYVALSRHGARLKCHDEECRAKGETPLTPFQELPTAVRTFYKTTFGILGDTSPVTEMETLQASDEGKKAFATGVRSLMRNLPTMNLKTKTCNVRQTGVGWVCELPHNLSCPCHGVRHDAPENFLVANHNGCFVGCKRDIGMLHPTSAEGYPLPEKVHTVLFQYIDQRTFVTGAEDDTFIDEIDDDSVHFDDDVTNDLFKKTFLGTHSAYAKFLQHIKGSIYISSKDRVSTWYIFSGHKWEYDGGATNLMRWLSSDENLRPYYKARKMYSSNPGRVTKKIARSIDSLIRAFQNHGTQRGFVDECALFFNSRAEEFERKVDQNRYLVVFENGVFDLKTKTFRAGQPDDYASMSVGYDYEEVASEVIEEVSSFVAKILTDGALRRYVLKLLGSCVSGDTRDEKLHVWIGGGANGKSTLLLLLSACLGQYAASMKSTVLTQRSPPADNATPGMTKAVGKRAVVLQETNQGEKINEAALKSSLGQDKIDYRPLFKEAREFYPHYKMILSTNNPLTIQGTDNGIWRKVRMIPFESRFVAKRNVTDETETGLVEKLVQDQDGDQVFEADKTVAEKIHGPWKMAFMRILLDYYYIWLDEGLDAVPEKIAQFNQEYKASQNVIEKFLSDECVLGSDHRIHSSSLWDAFAKWQRGGETFMGKESFNREMKKHPKVRFSKGVDVEGKNSSGYIGIQLKES